MTTFLFYDCSKIFALANLCLTWKFSISFLSFSDCNSYSFIVSDSGDLHDNPSFCRMGDGVHCSLWLLEGWFEAETAVRLAMVRNFLSFYRFTLTNWTIFMTILSKCNEWIDLLLVLSTKSLQSLFIFSRYSRCRLNGAIFLKKALNINHLRLREASPHFS